MTTLKVWSEADSPSVTISGGGLHHLQVHKNFPTVVADGTLVTSGKWYYEVTIAEDVLAQIGWANPKFEPDSEEGNGVGDDMFSYSYDGHRCCKWHDGSEVWGERWKPGDVVGAALDLDGDNTAIMFSLNGRWTSMGTAFSNVDVGHGLIPVTSSSVSAGKGVASSLQFSFDKKSMCHSPPTGWDGWHCIGEAWSRRFHTLHGHLRFHATVDQLSEFLASKTGQDSIAVADENGQLPLHWAVKYKSTVDCIQLVHEAYPNAAETRDKSGHPKGKAVDVPLWRMHNWTGNSVVAANKIGRADTLSIFRDAARDQDVLRAQGKDIGIVAFSTNVEPEVRIGIYKLTEVSRVDRDTYNAKCKLLNIAKITAIRQTVPYYIVRANIESEKEELSDDEGKTTVGGNLPFHTAIEEDSSIQIVEALFNMYPNAVAMPNKDDDMPLGCIMKMSWLLEPPPKHEHDMELVEMSELWGCDGCGVPGRMNLTRYRCSNGCDFDYCGSCHEKVGFDYATQKTALESWISKAIQTVPHVAKTVDKAGWTQLHHAAMNRASVSIVTALVNAYPEATTVEDVDGDLPLQKAAAASANMPMEIFSTILKANPTAAQKPDKYGQLPLHRAIKNGVSLPICMALIEAYRDALQRASHQTSNLPLHDALEQKASHDVSSALLEAYPEAAKHPNSRGHLPLRIVMAAGSETNVDLFEKILGVFPGGAKQKAKDGHLPLHEAMYVKAPFRVTELLVEAYPDACKVQGGTNLCLPLHWAAYKGTDRNFKGEEVMKLLISKFPDGLKEKEKDLSVPLHNAMYGCTLGILKLLLEGYPGGCYETTASGCTPLHLAVQMGPSMTSEMVTLLFEKGPDAVNIRDARGNLPIHLLAQNQNPNVSIFKMVMDANPEGVAQKNNEEFIPLMVAAKAGNSEVAKLLMDVAPETLEKADPWTGMTALHYACISETPSLEMIDCLLSRWPQAAKIEADAVSKSENPIGGLTPLFVAISSTMDVSIVKRILEAHPEACNIQTKKTGMTPLHKVGSLEKQNTSNERNVLTVCKLLSLYTSDLLLDQRSRTWKDICKGSPFKLVREWARSLGTKFGRYKVDSERPIYRSATCDVFFATDVDPSAQAEEKTVALKIMHVKENFEHEIKQRKEANFDPRFIVRVLRDHQRTVIDDDSALLSEKEFDVLFDKLDLDHSGKLDVEEVFEMLKSAYGSDESNDKVSLERAVSLVSQLDYKKDGALSKEEFKMLVKLDISLAKKLNHGKVWTVPNEYCLVMPRAERNLLGAIMAENIAGRDFMTVRKIAFDVAKALGHMHEQGFVHGDIKPRNVVRVGESWKLIDLDASVKIGVEIGRKYSTGYAPPEFIQQLVLDQVNSEGSETIEHKIARCQESLKTHLANGDFDAVHDLSIRLKALKTANDENGISKQALLAHPSFDLWSFGVLLFELFTGTDLFNRDKNNDNLVNSTEERRVLSWAGLEGGHGAQQTDPSCFTPFLGLPVQPPGAATPRAAISNANTVMKSVFTGAASEQRVLDARNLCISCLHPDPSLRCQSVEQLLKHSFFADNSPQEQVKLKPLPEEGNCKWHFMISHYQGTGGDQSNTICLELEQRGWKVWYDNKMENITKEGMMEGVRCSVVFLLFMSKDVFSRKWVKEEISEAIRQKKPFLVMHEKDARHGQFDFAVGAVENVASDFQPIAKEIISCSESMGWERRDYLRKAVLDQIESRYENRGDHVYPSLSAIWDSVNGQPAETANIGIKQWLQAHKILGSASEKLEKIIVEDIGCETTSDLTDYWEQEYYTKYIQAASSPIVQKKFRKALKAIDVDVE